MTQFDLEPFSRGKRICVFDKATRKVFRSRIRDVASQRFFYDLPELDRPAGVAQALEKFFRLFEHAAAWQSFELEMTEDEQIQTQARNLLDHDPRDRIAEILSQHRWVVLENPFSLPLLTSDQPAWNRRSLVTRECFS